MSTMLETRRLILREMSEADAGHLLALGANPSVTRYIVGEPPLTTREQALAVLRERVFPQYPQRIGRWACILKHTGDFIGWCGVKQIPEDGEYDLGYRLLEQHWGQGYATEAATAVCDYARQHLPGQRVVGKVMHGNLASRRVLDKLGLVFEADIEEDGCPVAVYVLPA